MKHRRKGRVLRTKGLPVALAVVSAMFLVLACWAFAGVYKLVDDDGETRKEQREAYRECLQTTGCDYGRAKALLDYQLDQSGSRFSGALGLTFFALVALALAGCFSYGAYYNSPWGPNT